MSTGKKLVPPHNDDAEKSVLSALLMYQDAFDKVSLIISPSDFYHPQHRVIYSAIQDMKIQNTEAVDVITLHSYLVKKGLLEQAGGAAYIAELSSISSLLANVEVYARYIKDDAVRRAIIETGSDIVQRSYSEAEEPYNLLDQAERRLSEISISTNKNSAENYRINSSINDFINVLLQKTEGTYVSDTLDTGFDVLNKYLNGGFHKSDYIIIGARPSVGKTALAISLIRNMIRKGCRVAFFSLEMPSSQIIQRLISATSRVEQGKLYTGNVTDDEINRVTDAAESLYQAELYIVDEPNMALGELRSRARMLHREKHVDAIFIDYIGLIESGLDHNVPRAQEVGYISKALKQLARELKCPVITLCQVSREAADQEPQLNNLRESGSIEQDADVVMLIHRKTNLTELSEEDVAKLEKDKTSNANIQHTKLLVAKNRNGKTGTVFLGYLSELTSFESTTQDKSRFIDPSKYSSQKKG